MAEFASCDGDDQGGAYPRSSRLRYASFLPCTSPQAPERRSKITCGRTRRSGCLIFLGRFSCRSPEQRLLEQGVRPFAVSSPRIEPTPPLDICHRRSKRSQAAISAVGELQRILERLAAIRAVGLQRRGPSLIRVKRHPELPPFLMKNCLLWVSVEGWLRH